MKKNSSTQNRQGTKWQTVVTAVEQEFVAGVYRAGRSFPTLLKLCQAHGISNTTGRRVMQELKERGYIATRGRAGTRVLRTTLQRKTVYVCLRPEAMNAESGLLNSVYFVHEFMAGFAASEHGSLFELAPISSDFFMNNLEQFAGQQVLLSANVVLREQHGNWRYDEALVRRLQTQVQPIFFHGFPRLAGVTQLGTDLHAALFLPLRHLIEQGHERIGLIIADTSNVWHRERLQGYLDALHEAGIGFAPERVIVTGSQGAQVEDAALERLLSPANGITALACATDHLALRVLEWCRQRRIHIPEDLALTGCDDIPEVRLSLPSLTSVNGRDREKGALAASFLARRLGGEELPLQTYTLPPQLMVRQSSVAKSTAQAANSLMKTKLHKNGRAMLQRFHPPQKEANNETKRGDENAFPPDNSAVIRRSICLKGRHQGVESRRNR